MAVVYHQNHIAVTTLWPQYYRTDALHHVFQPNTCVWLIPGTEEE